jgi:hypothetical protein
VLPVGHCGWGLLSRSGLKMIQERGDRSGVEVGPVQVGRRLAGTVVQKAEPVHYRQGLCGYSPMVVDLLRHAGVSDGLCTRSTSRLREYTDEHDRLEHAGRGFFESGSLGAAGGE